MNNKDTGISWEKLNKTNIEILDAIKFDFKFYKESTWAEDHRKYTSDHVKYFYELVKELWSFGTDPKDLLPVPKDNLRMTYVGDGPRKSQMLQDIGRISLFTNEILILDPLHNPFLDTVFEDPEAYRFDTYKRQKFLSNLDPWIRAGIVSFCPDPVKIFLPLEKCLNNLETDVEKGRDMSSTVKGYESVSPEKIQQYVDEHPELIRDYLMSIIGSEPYFDEESRIEGLEDNLEIIKLKGDINLKELLYCASMTGSIPFGSSSPGLAKQIKDASQQGFEINPLDPFAHAFTSVNMPILNNVSPEFTVKMREEGRLESFRLALYDLWKKCDASSPEKREIFANEFEVRLQQSVKEAKSEWEAIDQDLLKWGGPAAGALGAAAITAGSLSLAAPALGFIIAGISSLVISRWKRRSLREKNPMSLLIDLESN